MTLQMPPDLLHYAEAATGPNASRREVCWPSQTYAPALIPRVFPDTDKNDKNLTALPS